MNPASAVQAPSPNLTVRTLRTEDGHHLVLTDHRLGEPLNIPLQDPDVVRHCNARFARTVTRVQDMITDTGPLDPETAGRALLELARAGRVFLTQILLRPRSHMHLITACLQAACPTWPVGRPVVPVMHVVAGPAEYLPWELLPLFDPAWNGEVRDLVGLQDACRAFPAFSMVVERRFPAGAEDDPCLDASLGRLPTRFAWHSGYEGARAELGFFRSQGSIMLEGPYPATKKEDDTGGHRPSFVEQLADPGLGVSGSRLPHADQIVHLSCHCRSDQTAAGEHFEYHFAGEDAQDVVVRLDDILADLFPAWHQAAEAGAPTRPLVFLNACGTAVANPVLGVSLLTPFQLNENRGVVASLANLPDRLAARFSGHFYRSLLAGATAGEALHRAKWRLLEDFANPLGLLYTLHGSARLHVSPVPAGNDEF
ncbi:CHAT domain-containing protein [Streptomyces luteogriseus]|uniref:CHAT domain-containing protein n=1 Tax=Streptomyces luteogriseus TaxID=68233 RepID=UPI0037AF4A9D